MKLKPCPFCGGARIQDSHIRDGRNIGCLDCGAGVHAFQPEASLRASNRWNTRPVEDALVSALEAQIVAEKALVEADELLHRAHAEGWDNDPTGSSHVTDANKRAGDLFEKAEKLRKTALALARGGAS